jgi:hypothetical protein
MASLPFEYQYGVAHYPSETAAERRKSGVPFDLARGLFCAALASLPVWGLVAWAVLR